jgi:hypothetical protein
MVPRNGATANARQASVSRWTIALRICWIEALREVRFKLLQLQLSLYGEENLIGHQVACSR